MLKVGSLRGINGLECKKRCVDIGCKRQRRMLMKLRGGTAELRIETGRWCGLNRDEQISKKCGADGRCQALLAALHLHGQGEKANEEVDGENCGWMA